MAHVGGGGGGRDYGDGWDEAGPSEAEESYPCRLCFRVFKKVKAVHGHMRVHERGRKVGAAAREEGLPPVVGGWAVSGQRGRKGRPSSSGDQGAAEPPAKRPCVEATKDSAWIAEMVRCAHSLMYLKTHWPCQGGSFCEASSSSSSSSGGLRRLTDAAVAVADRPEDGVTPETKSLVRDMEEINLNTVSVVDGVDAEPAKDVDTALVAAGATNAEPAKDDVVAEIKATASAADASDASAGSKDANGNGEVGSKGTDANGEGYGTADATANASEVGIKEATAMDMAKPTRMFPCSICGKSFARYQGLGGHMASHRNKATQVGENGATVAATDRSQAASRVPAKGIGKHICGHCGEEYPTGQALGGHMRKHYPNKLLLRKNTSKATAAPIRELQSAALPPAETAVAGVASDPLPALQTQEAHSAAPPPEETTVASHPSPAQQTREARPAALPPEETAGTGSDAHNVFLFGVNIAGAP